MNTMHRSLPVARLLVLLLVFGVTGLTSPVNAGDGRYTGGAQSGRPAKEGVELVAATELYPAGPGRDIAEAACIQCHGADFLPAFKKSRSEWLVTIDTMLSQYGEALGGGSALTITSEERDVLADYLAGNFGPNGPVRGLKTEVEYLLPLAHNTDLYLRSKNLPGRQRPVS